MKRLSTAFSWQLLCLLLCVGIAHADSSPSDLLQNYNLKVAAAVQAKSLTHLYRTTALESGVADKVKQIQEALQSSGFYQNCKIDGWFGPYTELAVMEYQRRNNLAVTGVVDDNLFKKLTTASSADKTISSTYANTSFAKYLKPTKSCPSTNSKLVAAAKSLIGATPQKTMENIFRYVRDRTTYKGYYNTSKGALGTFNSRVANCCDQAHLVVALLRAAGIPGRYGHATCRFKSGLQTGHVFAYAYVGGKWHLLDTVSKYNQIDNPTWSLKSSIKIYPELPF